MATTELTGLTDADEKTLTACRGYLTKIGLIQFLAEDRSECVDTLAKRLLVPYDRAEWVVATLIERKVA